MVEPASTGMNATADSPADTKLLRGRALRGGVMSLISQLIRMVTGLGTTLIVALYLGPEEFGLFAVAVAVQGLAGILRDSGLANSLIQKKDISDAHLNSVLWVGVAFSLVLAGSLARRPAALASAKMDELEWVNET